MRLDKTDHLIKDGTKETHTKIDTMIEKVIETGEGTNIIEITE